MTLSPSQIKKIYDGLPSVLDGVSVSKSRTGQVINRAPSYPRLYYTITSQGLKVGDPSILAYYLNEARTIKTEVWRRQNRARITVFIESFDIDEADRLVHALVVELNAYELGFNPINDYMQFRGADPPTLLQPFAAPDGRKTVQRYAVDFFVEYTLTWTKYFDVIKEVYIEVETTKENESASEFFYAAYNSSSNMASLYSLDAILS